MNINFNFRVDKRLLVLCLLDPEFDNEYGNGVDETYLTINKSETIKEIKYGKTEITTVFGEDGTIKGLPDISYDDPSYVVKRFKTFIEYAYPELYRKIQIASSTLLPPKPLMDLTEKDFISLPENLMHPGYAQKGLTMEDYKLIDKITESVYFQVIYLDVLEYCESLRRMWEENKEAVNAHLSPILNRLLHTDRDDSIEVCVIHPDANIKAIGGKFNNDEFPPYIVIGGESCKQIQSLINLIQFYLTSLITNLYIPSDMQNQDTDTVVSAISEVIADEIAFPELDSNVDIYNGFLSTPEELKEARTTIFMQLTASDMNIEQMVEGTKKLIRY